MYLDGFFDKPNKTTYFYTTNVEYNATTKANRKLCIIIVEEQRNESIKRQRNKEKMAYERFIKNSKEFYDHLDRASLEREKKFHKVFASQCAKLKEKIEISKQSNKRNTEMFNKFKENKKIFEEKTSSQVFKQQQEMVTFFSNKINNERRNAIHSQKLHMTAAKKYELRKRLKNTAIENTAKEAEKDLEILNEKLNKSLDFYQKINKSKMEKSAILNKRLNEAQERIVAENCYSDKKYIMVRTYSRLRFNNKINRNTEFQSSIMNRSRSYKECFQHKADMEEQTKLNAAKELLEKEERFNMVYKRNISKLDERKVINKLKHINREENFQRVRVHQLLKKKDLLEKLKIPLEAYPDIAKVFQ